MCRTRQSLARETWADFFDGLGATDGPSLVAVEVVRKRSTEQRIGMPRTLSQISYDLDRDVLKLTSGALDENDVGVLRHFIQADPPRATCRAAGRRRRRPCNSRLPTTTGSAPARRACRQGTSA